MMRISTQARLIPGKNRSVSDANVFYAVTWRDDGSKANEIRSEIPLTNTGSRTKTEGHRCIKLVLGDDENGGIADDFVLGHARGVCLAE
jgi:hypothetical protein